MSSEMSETNMNGTRTLILDHNQVTNSGKSICDQGKQTAQLAQKLANSINFTKEKAGNRYEYQTLVNEFHSYLITFTDILRKHGELKQQIGNCIVYSISQVCNADNEAANNFSTSNR